MSDRIVWLAKRINNTGHDLSYAILLDERTAIRWADGHSVGWNEQRLAWLDENEDIVEQILGVELSPGEYCPIQINIKNMLKAKR